MIDNLNISQMTPSAFEFILMVHSESSFGTASKSYTQTEGKLAEDYAIVIWKTCFSVTLDHEH